VKQLFYNYDKISKHVKNILLKENNLVLISELYTFKNNLNLLKQLESIISTQFDSRHYNEYFNTDDIKTDKINYMYVFLYYLYFCDISALENMH